MNTARQLQDSEVSSSSADPDDIVAAPNYRDLPLHDDTITSTEAPPPIMHNNAYIPGPPRVFLTPISVLRQHGLIP